MDPRLNVLKKLEEAAKLARTIQRDSQRRKNWGTAGSWDYIATEIEKIIECDHGEAGLRPMLNNLKEGE
jgi:hypothetical protein